MAMKTLRVRVHAGHLELLEPFTLVEGAELEVTLPAAEAAPQEPAKRAVTFRSWNMGVKEPLTREGIYEDVG